MSGKGTVAWEAHPARGFAGCPAMAPPPARPPIRGIVVALLWLLAVGSSGGCARQSFSARELLFDAGVFHTQGAPEPSTANGEAIPADHGHATDGAEDGGARIIPDEDAGRPATDADASTASEDAGAQDAGCPTCNAFVCDDGRALPLTVVCDGFSDCIRGEDEAQPGCHSFRCDDGRFIPHEFVCDAETDCPGGEDEASCDAFACRDGRLIPRRNLCNGSVDCSEAEDEESCPP